MGQGDNLQVQATGINPPVVRDETVTRGFATDFVMDPARPTLAIYTWDITLDAAGEWGLVEMRIGPGAVPAFVAARVTFGGAGSVAGEGVQLPATFFVPPGWFTRLIAVNLAGTPIISPVRLIEVHL